MGFLDDTWQSPELSCCSQTTAASSPWGQEDDHIAELKEAFQVELHPKEILGRWTRNLPIVLKVVRPDKVVKARRKREVA